MDYREEQFGWIFSLLLIGMVIFIYFSNLFKIGSNPPTFIISIIASLVFSFSLLLFYKLKITVNDEFILVSFGIGLIRKKILLSDIASVKNVRNKWYNGWGIRLIKGGWLYNIHGLSAIEITFKNKKSFVRIGTKPNSNLKSEIEKRINKHQ